MFSEPEPFGTHFTSRPSQSGTKSQWTIGNAVADVLSGVLTGQRVDGVRAQRMLDRRPLRPVEEGLVDPRRVQREVLADPAVVDRDTRVLTDEVLLVVRDRDVPDDRVEDAPSRHRGLALARGDKRVAEVLRDVLERPHVEVRGCVLDGLLQIGGDSVHRFLPSSVGAPAPTTSPSPRLRAQRGVRRRSTRAASCPSSGCARASRPRSRRRRTAPRASSRRARR